MKRPPARSSLRLVLTGLGLLGATFCPIHAAAAIPASGLPADHVVREVTVLDFDESQGTAMAAGILRRHIHGQQGTLAVFELKQGARVPLHQHPNEQTSYIVKGRVEVIAAGRKHVVSAGQVIVLPPGVPHAFLALEDTTDIDFFSPARGDWQRGDNRYFHTAAPAAAAASASVAARLSVYAQSPLWLPNGVAVTPQDRKFLSLPRWTDAATPSVAELHADGRIIAYPGDAWNFWQPGGDPAASFVSVNAVWADKAGSLWVVDSGRPRFGELVRGAPKLVRIDTRTNTIAGVFPFDETIAPPGSYMNDVRVDQGWAYLSDSGLGALVVVDLASGRAARLLANHPSTQADPTVVPQVDGRDFRNARGEVIRLHVNDIALSPDGAWLYYQPTAGPSQYRLPTGAIQAAHRNGTDPAAAIENVGETRTAGGMEFAADGSLYLSDLARGALWQRTPDGRWSEVVRDERIVWPDAMGFGPDGSLYFPAAQVHLLPVFSRSGASELRPPYLIFRYGPDSLR